MPVVIKMCPTPNASLAESHIYLKGGWRLYLKVEWGKFLLGQGWIWILNATTTHQLFKKGFLSSVKPLLLSAFSSKQLYVHDPVWLWMTLWNTWQVIRWLFIRSAISSEHVEKISINVEAPHDDEKSCLFPIQTRPVSWGSRLAIHKSRNKEMGERKLHATNTTEKPLHSSIFYFSLLQIEL